MNISRSFSVFFLSAAAGILLAGCCCHRAANALPPDNDPQLTLERYCRAIRQKTSFCPKVVIVLGSGLENVAEIVKAEQVIPFGVLPGFPVTTVKGHPGRIILGTIGDVPVAVLQGRLHYYEGYRPEEIALPVRLMRKLGGEILILTNAAGGMQPGMAPGDLMLIDDHISTLMPSPLRGKNLEELGPRFPDMSEVYDPELKKILLDAAARENISMKRGIFIQAPGPAFETPAEIRMLRNMGGDSVAMSTATEAQAAVHCGMRVCGISTISNLVGGLTEQKLSHEEVFTAGKKTGEKLKAIFRTAIPKMK